MPSVEDIRKFNKSLISLGNEPAVLARRGEEIEEIPPPEEGLPEGLSDLLDEEDLDQEGAGEEGAGGEAAGAEAAAEAEAEAGPESAEEAGGEGAAEAGAGEPEEEEVEELADEDFLSQFAEAMEETTEPPEEAGETAEEAAPGGGEGGAAGEAGEAGEEGPEGAEAGEPPEAPEAAEGEEEDFGFELPEDLDFSEEPEPEGEGEAEVEAAEPGGTAESEEAGEAAQPGEGEAGEDVFGDIDATEEEDPFAGIDLGDEDFSFEEPGEEEEPAAEAGPEAEAETEEPGQAESEGEEEEEEFELPEGFDLESELGEFGEEPEEAGGEEEAPAAGAEPAQEPGAEEAGEAAEEEEASFSPPEAEEFSFEAEAPEESVGPEEAAEGEEGFSAEEFSFDAEAGEDEFGAEEEDFEVDEFSLGDFGAEFGVLEEAEQEEESTEEELNPALDVSGEPPQAEAAPEGESGELELSDEEFDRLKRNLAALPLNVKLAVEEIVGEAQAEAKDTERLVRQVSGGESAKTIADTAGRILGREIPVPKGYEKRTGVAFEQERATLGYQFRENLLPVLRVVALAGLAIGLIAFLSYQFVYKPLQARNLYEQGLTAIENDEYALGNRRFNQAVEVRRVKGRYYQYADRFQEDRQYQLAQEKYEQLLTHYPGDKRGLLEYARLESETLANYEHAEELVNRILDDRPYDYEALIAKGDNYMRWGEEDPAQYEQARAAYAKLIQEYGYLDPLLFKMLVYFIRTDNLQEVLRLKETFRNDPDREIDPRAYSALGGYLIDKGRLSDVREILMRSKEVDNSLPRTHYHLGRYFNRTDEGVNERTALRNALSLLQAQERLSRREISMLVDTRRRLGNYYYRNEEYVTAQEHYEAGIEQYEDARQAGVLEGEAMYGKLYARLGDIFYYQSHEYGQALRNYNTAEENGFNSQPLDYKQGFVHYRQGEYAQAVNAFMDSSGDFTQNRNLLLATANTLYQRQSYSAAEGYYRDLIEGIEAERSRIGELQPEQNPDHRALVEYQIRAYNNLGATLYQIYDRGSDRDKLSESLVALEKSTELSVNYRRNPQTGARAERQDLASLNTRHILYPETDYTVQLYNELPKDLEARRF
jgi:tetratricopeptide (TPR) repeat protein